jgi:integrase
MGRGHVRERRPGVFELVYDLPRLPGEGRNQKTTTVCAKNKTEAEKALRKIQTSIDENTYVDADKVTVEQYLARWLEDYATANLEQSTVDGYTIIVKMHLVPVLGKLLLSKLTPMDVQSYYSKALRKGRPGGRGGLSPRTVLSHHKLLHKALKMAVKWQILTRNVCDAVEPPRAKAFEAAVCDEVQAGSVLGVFVGTDLYIPVLFTLATGLRRGEVLALRWKDLDKEAMTITINQALIATTTGPIFKKPKTKKSRRVIALPGNIMGELERHDKKQIAQRLLLGKAYLNNGLICALADGTPWHPNTFSDAFGKTLVRSGLKKIRFHDLRHTHASLLLKQGVHPKVVSERLGHSNIGITMDLYSHIMPGLQEEAARKLGDLLFPNMSDKKQ